MVTYNIYSSYVLIVFILARVMVIGATSNLKSFLGYN